MGKSKGGSSTSTKMDPTQSRILNETWNFGKEVANRPYQAYGGQTIADFTPEQQAAFGMATRGALGNVGGSTLQSAVGGTGLGIGQVQRGVFGTQQAIDATQQAGGYNPMQIGSDVQGSMSRYFNPYQEQVVDSTINDIDRARRMSIMGGEDQAIQAGAYGGSRHGVADSLTNEAALREVGRTTGALRQSGFDTAVGYGQQADMANVESGFAKANLGLGAAGQTGELAGQIGQLGGMTGQLSGQLAQLSDQERAQYFGNAGLLEGVGASQQDMNQKFLTDAQRRWQEEQDYPLQQLGIMQNIQAGMPSMGGTTSSSQKGSAMDGIGQAVGIAGSIAMLSDKNIKSGIRAMSDEEALAGLMRTPVKKWRYDPAKGGPDDGGVEHTGAMAQDFKKNLGIGSGRAVPVVDAIGASMAATRALAKKVDKLSAKKRSKR